MNNIRNNLLSIKDEKYRKFTSKLTPTVNPDTIIGIKTPILRAFAKRLYKENSYNYFLRDLPHKYFEENNLHSFIIEQIPDFNKCIDELERFLPFVDNWATCDSMRPKCFKKNKDKLILKIYEWVKSNHTYTVRFGIEMIMTHFLDEDFKPEYLEIVSKIKSEDYYINMMISWFFSSALAKQWCETILYIENKKLSEFAHKKTIQKATESFRISDKQKQYLRTKR